MTQNATIQTDDLPRPDTTPQPGAQTTARRLPNVLDTGRISFGAACRPPVQK
jgi:hypothetical protein